jgi:DNA-binding transcriptional MerR regulator
VWTPGEVAERYGLAVKTLRNWRSIGYGPKAIKIGNRVRYAETELARWEAERQQAAR